MKRTILTLVLGAALLLGAVACEEHTPNGPSDQPQEEPIPDPEPEPEPELPTVEADYLIAEDVIAHTIEGVNAGVRNDYISFLDNATGYTLFLDIYTTTELGYLPEGYYPLGDEMLGCCYREYTYFMEHNDADLVRFAEGGVEVKVSLSDKGKPTHTVWGKFTTDEGVSVGLVFRGTIHK